MILSGIILLGAIPIFALFMIEHGNYPEESQKPDERTTRYIKSDANQTAILNAGKKIFDQYCIACHGADGKGNGPAAYRLDTKPTDFTTDPFKFKSTPYGTRPTENDLITTLKLGVRTTAMLPQLQLDEQQMYAVAKYILSLSPPNMKMGESIPIPPAPDKAPLLINNGERIFKTNCARCHGEEGKGDGPLAKMLVDYKQNPIRPANLTERPLKRANTPEGMYRIISIGVEGTPMPPFQQALKPDDIWATSYYLETFKIKQLTSSNKDGMGMMGRMMGGMMGMRKMFVGEEFKGMQIDMAAARALMMGNMMGR